MASATARPVGSPYEISRSAAAGSAFGAAPSARRFKKLPETLSEVTNHSNSTNALIMI
jgi:hypothetical protein